MSVDTSAKIAKISHDISVLESMRTHVQTVAGRASTRNSALRSLATETGSAISSTGNCGFASEIEQYNSDAASKAQTALAQINAEINNLQSQRATLKSMQP